MGAGFDFEEAESCPCIDEANLCHGVELEAAARSQNGTQVCLLCLRDEVDEETLAQMSWVVRRHGSTAHGTAA